MAKSPKPKHVSRRRLARQIERRRQRRTTILVSAGIVVVVLGVIIYGILYNSVIVPNQAVARVGNESITTRDWQTTVRYQRLSLIRQYQQYYQIYSSVGMDPASQTVITQLEAELNNSTALASNVLDQMIDDIVIRNEAKKAGITVTQAEIDQALEAAFGYFPNGTPTPSLTPTPFVTSTLNPTELFLVSPTLTTTSTPTPSGSPTPTGTSTATSTPTLSPTQTGTFVPTPSQTPTVTASATHTATAQPTATQTPIPSATVTLAPSFTPTPFTEAGYRDLVSTFIANANSEGITGFTETDIRKILEAQLYRQKMEEYETRNVSDVQEEVWARHIVLADETAATAALQRLKNGEDWTKVCAQVSTDTATKDSGGNLGWFPKGLEDAALETSAFSLQVGQVSDPVKTSAGWELIQVVGHETRPLDASTLQQLKSSVFQKWLEGVKATLTINKYDYYTQRVPTEPVLPTPVAVMTPN